MPVTLRDRSSLKRKYVEVDDGDSSDNEPSEHYGQQTTGAAASAGEAHDDASEDVDDDDHDRAFLPGSLLIEDTPVWLQKYQKKGNRKRSTIRQEKAKNITPFRFIELPAELRNIIYEYALVDPNGLSLLMVNRGHRTMVKRGVNNLMAKTDFYDNGDQAVAQPLSVLATGLLRVSKQMYGEASPILYGQRIMFEGSASLMEFLMRINPNTRSQLLDISMAGWRLQSSINNPVNRAVFYHLQDASNLRCIRVFWNTEGHGERITLKQLMSAASDFIIAYGSAHGRKDAAVDVFQFNPWTFQRVVDRSTGDWRWSRKPQDKERTDSFIQAFRVAVNDI